MTWTAGGTAISTAFVGSTALAGLYVGSEKVWPVGGGYYPDVEYDKTIALLHADDPIVSGVVTDSSALAEHWRSNGGVTISTTEKMFGSGSLYFDGGAQSFIQPTGGLIASYAFGHSDFTIETWVKVMDFTHFRVIFDGRPSDHTITTAKPAPAIVTSPNTGQVLLQIAGSTVISGGSLTARAWHHVAVCRSSGQTRLFVDGKQTGATYADANDYGIGPDTDHRGRPLIGANAWDANDPLNNMYGYMDEYRVTKAARYTANFPVPTLPF